MKTTIKIDVNRTRLLRGQPVDDRFWSKVDKHGPRAGRLGRCWVWIGQKHPHGYGRFQLAGRRQMAHRVAWGDVPDGMNVLHHCDNPPCVRRSHLFLGTQADNMQDSAAKGRHHGTQKIICIAGHPYDEANTYHGKNGRQCRTCKRDGHRIQRAARKVAGG